MFKILFKTTLPCHLTDFSGSICGAAHYYSFNNWVFAFVILKVAKRTIFKEASPIIITKSHIKPCLITWFLPMFGLKNGTNCFQTMIATEGVSWVAGGLNQQRDPLGIIWIISDLVHGSLDTWLGITEILRKEVANSCPVTGCVRRIGHDVWEDWVKKVVVKQTSGDKGWFCGGQKETGKNDD